jgi:hypothetical protein
MTASAAWQLTRPTPINPFYLAPLTTTHPPPQFAATAGTVKLAHLLGWIDADPFEWSKVKYFAIYVLAFSGGTWSNMKASAHGLAQALA